MAIELIPSTLPSRPPCKVCCHRPRQLLPPHAAATISAAADSSARRHCRCRRRFLRNPPRFLLSLPLLIPPQAPSLSPPNFRTHRVEFCWNFDHSLPVYMLKCARSFASWLRLVVELRRVERNWIPIEICPPCLQFLSDFAETSATACSYMCQAALEVSQVGSVWLSSCDGSSEMAFHSRFARRVFNLRRNLLKLRPQPAGIYAKMRSKFRELAPFGCWAAKGWAKWNFNRDLRAVSSIFVGFCWNFGYSLPVYVPTKAAYIMRVIPVDFF